jgi:hypothetical protein
MQMVADIAVTLPDDLFDLTGFDSNIRLTDEETDFVLASGGRPEFKQMTFTLHEQQVEVVKEVLKALRKEAKQLADDGAMYDNQNSNGNALYLAMLNLKDNL